MPIALPSRLCELCLTSDMDNRNISAYHSNISLRNKQKMPQNTGEVSQISSMFFLLNQQELRVPLT